jgi:hypothetical protein
MELADQQVADNEGSGGLTGAEIPTADVPVGDAPAEKLSLREQITKNIETVRTEEAKRARAADGKFTKLEGAAETPATDKEVSQPEKEASPEAIKSCRTAPRMVCGVQSVLQLVAGRSPDQKGCG